MNVKLSPLLSSHQQISGLLQHLRAGVVIHHPDTNILFANEKAIELLGVTSNKVTGLFATDGAWHFVREDGSPMPIDEYPVSVVLRTSRELDGQILGICGPDGKITWVEISAYPILNEDQTIVEIVVTFVDVTETKTLTDRLRLFQSATDASPNGIIIADALQPDCPIIYANQAFLDLTQYDETEVLGKNCRFLQGIDTNQPATALISQAIQTQRSQTVLLRNYKKDGVLFWNHLGIAPVASASGRVTHIIGTQDDLTDVIESKETLRRSEQELLVEKTQLMAVLNSTIDGIISLDQDQRIRLINHGAETIFGYKAAELIGGSLDVLLPEVSRANHKKHVKTFGAAGIDARVMSDWRSVHGIRADGTAFPALVSIGKARIGKEVTFTAIVRDMSDFLAQERVAEARLHDIVELKLKAAQFASDSRAKTEFLSLMSHELRTPLNAITSYAALLGEELSELGLEQQVSDIDHIKSASRHLMMLINKVLDINKIEAGQLELSFSHFSLASFLNNLELILKPLAKSNRNNLVFDCPGDLGFIEADELRLSQTLINLAGNALKFTQDGTVSVKCWSDTDTVGFSVSDTGIGMSPEHLKKLFLPFVQADSTITKTFGGTGLGLVLSKTFVESMGGSISVKSELNIGSEFSIRLPREQDQPKTKLVSSPKQILEFFDKPRTNVFTHHQKDIWQRLQSALSNFSENSFVYEFSLLWTTSCPENGMPSLADLSKQDLTAIWPNLAILSVDSPDNLTLVQVGSGIKAIFGSELPDGLNLLDLSGMARDVRKNRYTKALADLNGFWWKSLPLKRPGSVSTSGQCGICLPVSGPKIGFILCIDQLMDGLADLPLDGRYATLSNAADIFEYIDLGFTVLSEDLHEKNTN